MIGSHADRGALPRVLLSCRHGRVRLLVHERRTPIASSRALHIREPAGMKSAWAQAFLKRSSASAAWSSFCWARRLWINPISAHPFSGFLRGRLDIRFQRRRATGHQEHSPKILTHGNGQCGGSSRAGFLHLDRFLQRTDRVVVVLPPRGNSPASIRSAILRSIRAIFSSWLRSRLICFVRLANAYVLSLGPGESTGRRQGPAPAQAATYRPSAASLLVAAVPSATRPTGQIESVEKIGVGR